MDLPVDVYFFGSYQYQSLVGSSGYGGFAFNAWVNITGLPSIQLPVHEAAGVPIGAQIVGSPFDESSLLRLASEVEQASPWADRRAALATA